jgi:hypothetical protein
VIDEMHSDVTSRAELVESHLVFLCISSNGVATVTFIDRCGLILCVAGCGVWLVNHHVSVTWLSLWLATPRMRGKLDLELPLSHLDPDTTLPLIRYDHLPLSAATSRIGDTRTVG